MRKLLLDSANIEAIRALCQSNAVAGVTTNPSLMAKEGKGDYLEKLEAIAMELAFFGEHGGQKKHLSVEVTSLDPHAMVSEAVNLHAHLKDLSIDLYVKIPMGPQYLRVMTDLSCLKVKVNATAIMTYAQAKLATDAGASIVSFFFNRMKDGNIDPTFEIMEYRYFNDMARATPHERIIMTPTPAGIIEYDPSADIICGSIRTADDVRECWDLGAHYVTASPKIIEELCSHPETTKAIEQFKRDIDQWRS